MPEATKPKFFNIPSLETNEEAKVKGVTAEETAYYAMSKSKGWKQLIELCDRVVADLDDINNQAISAGATFEDIGRNTLVISFTKDIIKKLFNKVEDAREACESERNK